MVISLFHIPCVMVNLNDHMRGCRSYSIEDVSSNLSYRDILRPIFDSTEYLDRFCKKLKFEEVEWLVSIQTITEKCYTNDKFLHRATFNNHYRTESKH